MPYAMETLTTTDMCQGDLDAIECDPGLAFLLEEPAQCEALKNYQIAFYKQVRHGALFNALNGLGVLDRPFYQFLKIRLHTPYPALAASSVYWRHLLGTASRMSTLNDMNALLGYHRWLGEVFDGKSAAVCAQGILFSLANDSWFRSSPHRKRRKLFAGFLVDACMLQCLDAGEQALAEVFLRELSERVGDDNRPWDVSDVLHPLTLRNLASAAMQFVEFSIPLLAKRFEPKTALYIMRKQGFRLFAQWLYNRNRKLALLLQENSFIEVKSKQLLPSTPMFQWLPAVVLGNFDRAPSELLLHLCQGESLRAAPGLNFPLTARAAHYFSQLNAGDDWDTTAMRARVESAGGSKELALELHQHAGRLLEWQDDRFVGLFIEFLIRFNGRIPLHQVHPLIDYLSHSREAQPDFSLKGRTPEALLRQMEEWHRELALARQLAYMAKSWKPAAVKGLLYTDKANRRYRIVQLTTGRDLLEESRTMHHCVSSYSTRAALGRCSIWSLRRLLGDEPDAFERLVTIELSAQNTVVQVRGQYNRLPDSEEARIIGIWKRAAGLS